MNAFDAITSRQGALHFLPEPVSDELILRVLQAAVSAPSPANTQPWEFVVVTDRALVRQVAEYLVKTQEEYVFRRLLGAPESFTQHLLRLYEHFQHIPCFIVLCRHQRVRLGPAEYDGLVRDWDLCCLGAAMANLMAVATELSLGTRWFGNPMMHPAPLKQLLGIPAQVEPVAVTPLGYHSDAPKERPRQPLSALTGFQRGDKYKLAALLQGKLALEEVVHFNRFGLDPETRDGD